MTARVAIVLSLVTAALALATVLDMIWRRVFA